ncbi:MAG: hypothetical protein WBC06_10250 [Chitinophagaceae bacterium]
MKAKSYYLFLFVITAGIVILSLSAYTKKINESNPLVVTVKTLSVTNITSGSATCKFSVTDPDKLPKTLGVCIGKSNTPTTSGTKFGLAKGTQGPLNFFSEVTGLTASTTVYVRAYAIVNGNTVYGNTLSFKTLPPAGK